MSALERAFEGAHPALIPYLTAGDPDPEATKAYVQALERGGADVIELGLPFSEPIAEGPTIQGAIRRALDGGMTPAGFFDLVTGLDVNVPLVVMTYYNLIYQFGDADEAPVEPFVRTAAEAGLSGIIVPDLPVEESGLLADACERHGLDLVYIVAPTTSDERLTTLLEHASGFVYVQARLGTTGARANVSGATHESLARIPGSDVPRAVGFGVSEPEHAAEIVAAGADGVIVGSALVDIVASGTDVPARLESKVAALKTGAREGFEQGRPRTEHT